MSRNVLNKHKELPNRRSIRLRGYDYSRPGYYFITICIHDRKKHLFGIILNKYTDDKSGKANRTGGFQTRPIPDSPRPSLHPTEYAEIVQDTWNDLPNHIANIALDEFIIMPNHVHGIIRILDSYAGLKADKDRAGLEPAPTRINISTKIAGLPEIVRQFKTFSAKRINIVRQSPGVPVWQRNYYEHIIRDEQSLYRIRKYIRDNPAKWADSAKNHIPHEITEFGMVKTH